MFESTTIMDPFYAGTGFIVTLGLLLVLMAHVISRQRCEDSSPRKPRFHNRSRRPLVPTHHRMRLAQLGRHRDSHR